MASREEWQKKTKTLRDRVQALEISLASAEQDKVAEVAVVEAKLQHANERVAQLLYDRATADQEHHLRLQGLRNELDATRQGVKDVLAERNAADVEANSWREQLEIAQQLLTDLREHYETVARMQLERERDRERAILNRKALAGGTPGFRR
jgi:predicted sulfurtransferase